MTDNRRKPESLPRRAGSFPSTRWTLIRTACQEGRDSRDALASLCQIYWPAIYTFARQRGHSPDQAEDLTQGFFAKLLEKNYVAQADPMRGRFRTFLLSAFTHYIANEWDRERAQKRGGGNRLLSLDFSDAEGCLTIEPVDSLTPENIFARKWARTLLDRVLSRLQQEMSAAGKADRFDSFRAYLGSSDRAAPLSVVAADLGMTETAAKVAVHRLRRRFGRLVREEVAHTVSDESQIDEEIRLLIDALGS
jgi:RNA polymerase sigma factor (sigma-70 family)